MDLLPYLLFAFVASITPGPTNILILTNSQRYGVRATLSAVAAACVSASVIVLISGAGAGELLHQHPLVRQLMSWTGALWLSWLSWQLFNAPAPNLQTSTAARFTARAAALLQIVNPKTWMMALAWAWLGQIVNRIFRTPAALVRFQRAMALLLLISAWAGML